MTTHALHCFMWGWDDESLQRQAVDIQEALFAQTQAPEDQSRRDVSTPPATHPSLNSSVRRSLWELHFSGIATLDKDCNKRLQASSHQCWFEETDTEPQSRVRSGCVQVCPVNLPDSTEVVWKACVLASAAHPKFVYNRFCI